MVSVMRLILAVGMTSGGGIVEPARLDIRQRNRGEQLPRIGMLRRAEDPRDRSVFDDFAMVQDRDVVAEHADHRQIVADEHHGEAEPRAQLLQQQQDMRLRRHVEAGHDLVGDDEIGLQRQRPGDPGALALAARQLVRIAVDEVGRQADQIEQSRRAIALVAPALQAADAPAAAASA